MYARKDCAEETLGTAVNDSVVDTAVQDRSLAGLRAEVFTQAEIVGRDSLWFAEHRARRFRCRPAYRCEFPHVGSAFLPTDSIIWVALRFLRAGRIEKMPFVTPFDLGEPDEALSARLFNSVRYLDQVELSKCINGASAAAKAKAVR
jgi:hypothetical protein